MNLEKIYDAEAKAYSSKVEVCLKSFKACYNAGDPDGAAGRLYYACYHAVYATLLKFGKEARTHKGVNMELANLIKERSLDRELLITFSQLQTLRLDADYNPNKGVDSTVLEDLVKPAYHLIEVMKNLYSMSGNVK